MAVLFQNLLPSARGTSFFNLLRHGMVPKSRDLLSSGCHGKVRKSRDILSLAFRGRHGMIPSSRDLLSLAFRRRFTCSRVQDHYGAIATELSDQKQRRSANYKPPNWDNEQLQSLKNEYAGGKFIERSNFLKEQVKMMLLDEGLDPLFQLELIDDLQRLGVSYNFEDQIQSILTRIYNKNSSNNIMISQKGLYETALEFRLLRQHHFDVPQEVFDCFRREKGDFKANLIEDTKGLLYLYEASFLLTESESTLELAREFTTNNLKKSLEEKTIDEELVPLVRLSLELPLHWRMLRLEARCFIDVYEKRSAMNPTILELAKLDFNIVQATHQKDLQYASRWWKSTDFAEKLRFARDRLVENFFWGIGINFYPQYGHFRTMLTKVNSLLSALDDIFDVYGTMDELELFTDAFQRWDIKVIDQLPDYMKIYYLEFHNTINKMANDAIKDQDCDIDVISYIRKKWTDLCRTYLQEAKWYSNGYTPTLEEYMNNAWISISAPVMLLHTYLLISKPIKKEALECLDGYHQIVRCSATIMRLSNDLGTSLDEVKRGDVPKSLQCYMNESGASEEEARKYIKQIIDKTWKEFNLGVRSRSSTPFSKTFVEMAMNLSRVSQCIYQNGDGHGHQDSITRQRILALLFEPICLPKAS